MNNSSRKVSEKKLEKREREFNVYVSGANQDRVLSQQKKEKQSVSQTRTKSKDSRKSWGVQPAREQELIQSKNVLNTESNEPAQPKERKKWNVNRNQSVDDNANSPTKSNKSYSEYPDPSIAQRESTNLRATHEESEHENEEIRNFISTMNKDDLDNLRKSMRLSASKDKPTHDEDSRINPFGIDDSIENMNQKKEVVRKIDLDDEIQENILSDDDEDNQRMVESGSKTDYPFKSSTTKYTGPTSSTTKPIKTLKARPISATVNQVKTSRNFEPGMNYEKSTDLMKQVESPKIELPIKNMTKNVESSTKTLPNPFKKSQKSSDESSREESNQTTKESEKSETSFSSKDKNTDYAKRKELPPSRASESILKRIEQLDDNNKKLLEDVLDKIEKGSLNKEILLSLDFLHLKEKSSGASPTKAYSQKPPSDRQSKEFTRKSNIALPPSVESKITKFTEKAKGQEPSSKPEEKKKNDSRKNTPERLKISLPDNKLKIPAAESAKNMNAESQRNIKLNEAGLILPPSQAKEGLKVEAETVRKRTSSKDFSQLQGLEVDSSIQIRLISTWGSISQAGLTEIQAFDENGKRIELNASNFVLKNCGSSAHKTIEKLANGKIYTIDIENMWLCNMPAPPITPEIYINFKSNQKIGGFRIWNYNRSLIDSIKGIKEIEIVSGGLLVWAGIINRAPGNEYEEYVTEIYLKQNIRFPDISNPNQAFKSKSLNPKNDEITLEKLKQDSAGDRPISVPIWLEENIKKPTSTNDLFSVRDGLSRRGTDKPSTALLGDREPSSKDLKLNTNANSTLDINDNVRLTTIEDTKSKSTRSRNNIKVPDVFDELKTNRKVEVADNLEKDMFKPSLVKNDPKKDDNYSINSIELFNLTNNGRIKPAKRESLIEVKNVTDEVLERIKNVEGKLGFKHETISEDSEYTTKNEPEDILGNLKAKSNVASAKDNIKTESIGQKGKGSYDVLDSMMNKGERKASASGDRGGPIKPMSNKPLYYDGKSVKIPELPKGRVLKFMIYSTWGDSFYVGLNGIEIFDENGDPIQLFDVKSQLRADPPDINCLPGYGKDPRTIDKIVDGTYLTCDDLHVWLAPFTKGRENLIEIDFKEVRGISMIRIWNYNKSRIHSYRGVRDMGIKFDEKVIFLGEISKATGSLKGAEHSCEYILFTQNEKIFTRIEKVDWLNKIPKNEDQTNLNATAERPKTGTRKFDENDMKQIKDMLSPANLPKGIDGRPLTMAKLAKESIKDQIERNKRELDKIEKENKMKEEQHKKDLMKKVENISAKDMKAAEIKCKRLTINILKSWGDNFYTGLTGFELYDKDGNVISLKHENLNAKPKDLSSIPGYAGDHRTLDKLINGNNYTTDDNNMWLIPFIKGQGHYIYISFSEEKTVSAIKIWNYNKSEEDSYRGACLITISADGVLITPETGILLKKAPGHDFLDYGQYISLPFCEGWDDKLSFFYKNIKPKPANDFMIQEYDTVEYPTGFSFRIAVISTWGDLNYCGLNGIEFYNQFGDPILQTNKVDFKIAAEPSSVNVLPGHEDDIRTVDNLVNGQNDTYDDRNMWLAPYLLERRDEGVYKTHRNEIIINFDLPQIISCIKFWNYTKTPDRGAREIEIHVDDSIIFRGYIRNAPTYEEFRQGKDMCTGITFTKDGETLKKINPNRYNEDGDIQKVVLVNEKRVVMNATQRSDVTASISLERPTTSVKGFK